MEKSDILLEHFDLAPPSENGDETIIYPHVFQAAKEAARIAGWTFRSYSSADSAGTLEDFENRGIKVFPTLIIYKEGLEMGRYLARHKPRADYEVG